MSPKFFYAVRVGRKPGVYNSWEECKQQVDRFPCAVHKKFSNKAEAQEFVRPSTSDGNDTSDSESQDSGEKEIDDKPGTKSDATEPATRQDDGKRDRTIIYTHAPCKRNGLIDAQARIGVWFGKADPRNVAEALRVDEKQTNNTGALTAIKCALEALDGQDITNPIVIKSNSDYAINCLEERIDRWQSNGWLTMDGKPVKNKSLIEEVHALLLRLRAKYVISLEHVGTTDADREGVAEAALLARGVTKTAMSDLATTMSALTLSTE